MDKERIEKIKSEMRENIKKIDRLIKQGCKDEYLKVMRNNMQEDLKKIDGQFKLAKMVDSINLVNRINK